MARLTLQPSALLRRMFDAAIARASPRECVRPFLPEVPRGRTIVVGAGKAAAAMAAAVEDGWSGHGGRPDHAITGLVVTRHGHGAATRLVEVIEAAHPVPDAASVDAATRTLALVRGLGPDDLVLCLISGGGSALLSLPAAGLTLADKQATNRALLKCGATIAEMNCVRKHLSAIKGGHLAAACQPARVVTLVISDVPGDDPATVASGPTVADDTTFAQARAVLQKYGVSPSAAVVEHLRAAREETIRADDPRLRGVVTHVIARAADSLAAAATVARQCGVTPILLGDNLEGESREVAAHHARIVADLVGRRRPGDGAVALLSGGETTVTVRGSGRGGRNAEFLLALALALDPGLGVHALAADTDGIDGTEDNAGAVLTPTTLPRAASQGLDPRAYLAANDAYGFFAALGDLVVTGPTRTNVNDFRAVLIAWPA